MGSGRLPIYFYFHWTFSGHVVHPWELSDIWYPTTRIPNSFSAASLCHKKGHILPEGRKVRSQVARKALDGYWKFLRDLGIDNGHGYCRGRGRGPCKNVQNSLKTLWYWLGKPGYSFYSPSVHGVSYLPKYSGKFSAMKSELDTFHEKWYEVMTKSIVRRILTRILARILARIFVRIFPRILAKIFPRIFPRILVRILARGRIHLKSRRPGMSHPPHLIQLIINHWHIDPCWAFNREGVKNVLGHSSKQQISPTHLADCPAMSFVFVGWHSRKWWPPIWLGT